MKNIDLKNDPLNKLFWHYLTASVISMLIAAVHRIIDAVFIGRFVGSIGIAAFNITVPALVWTWALIILFTVGGSTQYAILMGKESKLDALNIFYTTNIILAIFIAAVILFGALFLKPICLFLGCTESMLPYATSYMKIQLIFLPVLSLNGVISAFIKNDRNPKLVMYGIVISSVANILMNYVFIAVLGWGMAGASLATGIAQTISLLLLCTHFFKENVDLDFKFNQLKLKLSDAFLIIKTGLPSFLAETSFSVSLIFMNKVVGQLEGETGIAAVGIMFTLVDFIYIMIFGVATTMQPIVSFNHGAGEYGRVWGTLILSLKTAFCLSLALAIFGYFNAESLVKIINNKDTALIAMAAKLTGYNFITMPITAISTNIQLYYQSIGKAKLATLLTVMRNGFFVLLVLYTVRPIWGIEGVWLTYPIADILSAVVYTVCFIFIYKQYKPLLSGGEIITLKE